MRTEDDQLDRNPPAGIRNIFEAIRYLEQTLPKPPAMIRLALFALCVCVSPAASPQPGVPFTISPAVRLSDPGSAHAEPYIASHPEDSRRLVAAAIHFSGEQEAFVETYASKDGGRTWSLSPLPLLRQLLASKEMIMAADPWIAFAADGTVYASVMGSMSRPDHRWGALPILFYCSRNGGVSWQEPSVEGPYFDRPAFVVTGRGNRKQIFVAAMTFKTPSDPAGVGILRSDDGGASFQRVLVSPSNLGHNALNPVLAPDGSLLVPYVDFPARSQEQFERRRRLMGTSRIYLIASRDHGRTFGVPRIVADIPRLDAGFPVLAVDLSDGAHGGRIYMAWNGEIAERRNVMVGRSDDQGENWLATEVKAQNAGPAYFSSLAVSKDGIVGLAWIQHQELHSVRQCWRTYFAFSRDGGETFSTPEVVSGARYSCPTSPLKGHLHERGGDYIGLTAAADGAFHVVWPDSRDGPLQIYTATVRVPLQ